MTENRTNWETQEAIVATPTTVPVPVTTSWPEKTVVIRETETGWLRVRDAPSSAGVEVTKVKPKEKYILLEQDKDWLRIDLGDEKSGWILAKYADIS